MAIKITDNYPNNPVLYIDEKLVNQDEYEIDELEVEGASGLSMTVIGIEKNTRLLNNSLESFPLINFIKVIEDDLITPLNKINWISKYTFTFDRKSNAFEGKNDLFQAEFEFRLDSKFFKENLSYAQYQLFLEELNRFVENKSKVKIENFYMSFEGGVLGATLLFKDISTKNLLIDEIKKMLSVLTNIINNSEISFAKHPFTGIRTYYKFPDAISVSCEQYLLYFAQFLQDLGINATSNLKEEAGKVLFSITPTDAVEALDKIREALAVYLNLPSSTVVYDESSAAMRLKQQVDNLQHAQRMREMEFRLAQKVIESQDKIIQQKDSTIEQQSKIIEKIADKAVMINSAENKEELEEIFDGVKVGKSKFLAEQVGLHLNPATALKAVGKKLIWQEDDLISLNLNDAMEDKIIER